MNPYFVWNDDGDMIVDVAKAIDIYMYPTNELPDVNVYVVRASLDPESVTMSCDPLLARNLSHDEAVKFIDELRTHLNSNRSAYSGRPIITKTVSPEAFETVVKGLMVLNTSLIQITTFGKPSDEQNFKLGRLISELYGLLSLETRDDMKGDKQ